MNIVGMKARLDATFQLLTDELSTRIVSREFKHHTEQTEPDLTTGVVMLISAGEADYKNQKNIVGKEGTQSMLLIGQLRVAETDTGLDIEAKELTMIEEVKSALNVGAAGIGYSLNRVTHSRQLDLPYGWFVTEIEAGPAKTGVY